MRIYLMRYIYNRGLAFASLGKYDRAWRDIHKVTKLGVDIDPAFLKDLCKYSGRNELSSQEPLSNKEVSNANG